MITKIKSALSPLQEDALAMTQAAMNLSKAREENDIPALVAALDENLKLWIEIRTVIRRDKEIFPAQIRENLLKLSEFTAQKTFELGRSMDDKGLESLINTNLQIAEGLLESEANQ